MAEPSERDFEMARSLHVALRCCGTRFEDEGEEVLALEAEAKAIASAREEGDAAGFERGRREGLEEACRAACVHCRSWAPIAGVTPMTGTFYHPPKEGERGDFVGGESVCDASAIRALIGGNE